MPALRLLFGGMLLMRDNRLKQIEDLVGRREAVTMEELRRTFGVSMNTIRADVAKLVENGAVEKVYGGVRAVRGQEVPLFTHRTELRPQEKKHIARYAQKLIHDGDTIYIDAGTTAMRLIDFLDPAKRVTVVTGNLYVISRAYMKPRVDLIVLPGGMNRRTNSVADGGTLEYLARYRCGKAFMGASGVSPEGGLNVSSYMEYQIKKLALQQCQQAYLLLDSSKFGGSSLLSYGAISDMTEIVTDRLCPQAFRELCEQAGVKLTAVD